MQRESGTATWSGLEELRGFLECCLLRHCRDQNEIDDVVQETLVRAARYRRSLHEGERLRPWAARIALNVLTDLRRRQSRSVAQGEFEGGVERFPTLDESPRKGEVEYRIGNRMVGEDTALWLLRRVLPELRDDDRLLLASYYGGARSCAQTARECGVPDRLVKVHLYRARRRLVSRMRRVLALAAPLETFAVARAT